MSDAQGVNKLVVYKKESAWGTKAGATGGKYLRRVTASFQLEKDTYTSNEIKQSQQTADMRHGTRRSSGTLNGELAGNSYTDFIAASLRKDFAAGPTTGAVAVIAVDADNDKFIRSTGSFLTDGFYEGMVVQSSGFTTSGNNGFFVTTAVSALEMTVASFEQTSPLVDEIEGDTVTISAPGKVSYVPLTGHTDDSFTFEEWHPDAAISRTFLGVQVNQMDIAIQPNSMATINFNFMGKDAETPTGAAYFTTPAAQGTEGTFSGPDGMLVINGTKNGKVTGMNLSVAQNIQQEAVIGSNSIGAKSRGKVAVTLSGTAIFTDSTMLGYFDAETEISVTYALRSADRTDYFAIHMPRVKIGSGTTDDGEKVVILSFDGTALEYGAGGVGKRPTTIQIQDTAVV